MTTTQTAAILDTTPRGFPNLRCPLCAADGAITVTLGDLNDFTCPECEADFGRDQIGDLVTAAQQWQEVLAWLNTAPKLPE